jgi:hypothetical protein
MAAKAGTPAPDTQTAMQMQGAAPMVTSASSGYTPTMRAARRGKNLALRALGEPRDLVGCHKGNPSKWMLVFVRFEEDSSDQSDNDDEQSECQIHPAVLMSGQTVRCTAEIRDDAIHPDADDLVDTAKICWLQQTGSAASRRWGLQVKGEEDVAASCIFPHGGRSVSGYAAMTKDGRLTVGAGRILTFLRAAQRGVDRGERDTVTQAYRDYVSA